MLVLIFLLYLSAMELQQIGKALLPTRGTSKALPAPTETSDDSTVQKVEAGAEPKAEAPAEPALEINSVPKPEVKAQSFPGIPRPLSPYPYVIFCLIINLNNA